VLVIFTTHGDVPHKD